MLSPSPHGSHEASQTFFGSRCFVSLQKLIVAPRLTSLYNWLELNI